MNFNIEQKYRSPGCYFVNALLKSVKTALA